MVLAYVSPNVLKNMFCSSPDLISILNVEETYGMIVFVFFAENFNTGP